MLYDDGEIEILNLKNETWEFVKDGTIKVRSSVIFTVYTFLVIFMSSKNA